MSTGINVGEARCAQMLSLAGSSGVGRSQDSGDYKKV
jgi:hypothetical protein